MTLEEIEKNEFYFWSGNGKVTSAVSDWHRTIERLAKDLNFRVHAHRFRHTLAAELISAGTDCPGRGDFGEHAISRRENLRAIY
jgi:integrase